MSRIEVFDDRIRYQAGVLADLHSFWKPHDGQTGIGKALFIDGKKEVVGECGRKLGKTEVLVYSLYRWGLSYPGSFNYYFAPIADQISDLVWKNGRMPYFLPQELSDKYISSISQNDRRINFKGGGFIKCDGSDNYEKARGYSATGLSVYDETKDFNKHFHDGYDPNRAITDAPLLAVGTPGDGNDLLSRLFDAAELTDTGASFRLPSHMNPHISAEFLRRKELEYRARGEYEIFMIEYLARRVKLGTKFIFPMLSKKNHVKPYDYLIEYVKRFRKDFDFYIVADPGSSKCFAVVFAAIHRYNKHIILLDEIYEKKLGENSAGKMAPRIVKIAKKINPKLDEFLAAYDHAGAWFYSELLALDDKYPINFVKCEKDVGTKESKLSLIKDTLLRGVLTMSDKCPNTYSEMENYKTDKNGKLIKEDDHAIDCVRYLYNLANYTTIEDARPLEFGQVFERASFETDEMNRSKVDGDATFDSYDDWYNDF